MAVLSDKQRNNLSDEQFAGPNRTYPIPDKRHAILAKGRALQEWKLHHITHAEYESIVSKAEKVIKGS
jgi:hypothetical protein